MNFKLILKIDQGYGAEYSFKNIGTTKFQCCPRVEEFIIFENKTYKIAKITHSENEIELIVNIYNPKDYGNYEIEATID